MPPRLARRRRDFFILRSELRWVYVVNQDSTGFWRILQDSAPQGLLRWRAGRLRGSSEAPQRLLRDWNCAPPFRRLAGLIRAQQGLAGLSRA